MAETFVSKFVRRSTPAESLLQRKRFTEAELAAAEWSRDLPETLKKRARKTNEQSRNFKISEKLDSFSDANYSSGSEQRRTKSQKKIKPIYPCNVEKEQTLQEKVLEERLEGQSMNSDPSSSRHRCCVQGPQLMGAESNQGFMVNKEKELHNVTVRIALLQKELDDLHHRKQLLETQIPDEPKKHVKREEEGRKAELSDDSDQMEFESLFLELQGPSGNSRLCKNEETIFTVLPTEIDTNAEDKEDTNDSLQTKPDDASAGSEEFRIEIIPKDPENPLMQAYQKKSCEKLIESWSKRPRNGRFGGVRACRKKGLCAAASRFERSRSPSQKNSNIPLSAQGGKEKHLERNVNEKEWNHKAFLQRSPSPCRARTDGSFYPTRLGSWRSKAGGIYLPPLKAEKESTNDRALYIYPEDFNLRED